MHYVDLVKVQSEQQASLQETLVPVSGRIKRVPTGGNKLVITGTILPQNEV